MGRRKSVGSLKPLLWYAPQLSGVGTLCFHILSSSGLMMGSGCRLMPAPCQVFFSFLSFLRVHWLTLENCNCWWLWHLCLLIWQGIFHFSCVLLWNLGSCKVLMAFLNYTARKLSYIFENLKPKQNVNLCLWHQLTNAHCFTHGSTSLIETMLIGSSNQEFLNTFKKASTEFVSITMPPGTVTRKLISKWLKGWESLLVCITGSARVGQAVQ